MLGYDQTQVFTSQNGLFDEVASEKCKAINLEVWGVELGKTAASARDTKNAIIASGMGIVATEGLYVPQYVSFVSAHYEALQRNTPQTLDDGVAVMSTNDQFPPDGSITPANLSKWHPGSMEFGCSEKSRADAGWEGSKCTQGRW